jgi:hypothetical protein
MRKFYRTIIKVEVLSETPYEYDDLDDVCYDIMDGDCSGMVTLESSEEVDGPTMAKLLKKQFTEPEFFNLDENGNDTEN